MESKVETKEINGEGCIRLLEAAIRMAGADYSEAINRRAEIEEQIMIYRAKITQLETELRDIDGTIKQTEFMLPAWATKRLREKALEERAKRMELANEL